MASQLTLILWTDHAADQSLASDLASEAVKQIFRSTSQQGVVISATAVTLEADEVHAAVAAFADEETTAIVVPTPDPAPPVVVPEPQPTNADGTLIPVPDAQPVNTAPDAQPVSTPVPVPDPAVPDGTTAASAGLVPTPDVQPTSAPVPDPATQVVDSDEHMAVLVQLFEALTPEQKAQLDAEVQTMEDAHAALERIYAPLVALETPAPDAPPVAS
jgi:hypothetical protein